LTVHPVSPLRKDKFVLISSSRFFLLVRVLEKL
jgi:hypothetical protein